MSRAAALLIAAVLSVASLPSAASEQQDMLTGYIIAHSHCDAGWRVTIEEYYETSVRSILTSTIEALQHENVDRRFIWAETAFFSMWFSEQSEETRQVVRDLVASGRLEMVEGGWVMSDEASADPYSRVNQMTLGHEYLLNTVNARPRIGWQIDPFGDSSITPLLYRQMGYQALVNDRISLRVKEARKLTKELQFIWSDAPSSGVDASLFTHTLDNWYWQPANFNWDEGAAPVTPSNIHALSVELANVMKTRSKYFQTRHVLYPFGHDFAFEDAHIMYDNMDQIVEYVNARSDEFQVRLRYATLSEFFTDVLATDTEWPVFSEDYLPFEDVPWGHFWVGHYTSRPLLKRTTRTLGHALRVAETSRALAAIHTDIKLSDAPVTLARQTSALMNHHDAITGTAREAVVEDYMSKMHAAIDESERSAAVALSALAFGGAHNVVSLGAADPEINVETQLPGAVFAYNSLAWTRNTVVKIKLVGSLPAPERILVRDEFGYVLGSQVTLYDDELTGDATAVLAFVIDVPAMGYRALNVSVDADGGAWSAVARHEHVQEATIDIASAALAFRVDGATGLLVSVHDVATGQSSDLFQDFAEYNSTTASGAYLFFPSGPATPTPPTALSVTIARGPVLSEVRSSRLVSNNQTVTQSIEVTSSASDSHVARLTIRSGGAIGENRELVTRLFTSWPTDRRYLTDNGLFLKAREYDDSWEELDAIASNYKPVISMAALRLDDESAPFSRLSLATAEAHGVASLEDGALEVMLQRRLMQDDGLGLEEGCDDQLPFDAHFALRMDTHAFGATPPRQLMVTHNNPVALFVAVNAEIPEPFLGLSRDLPGQVHLSSLEVRSDESPGVVVVRVNHLLEDHVDGWASQEESVSLEDLLRGAVLNTATEMTLNLNEEKGAANGTVTLAPGAWSSFVCVYASADRF